MIRLVLTDIDRTLIDLPTYGVSARVHEAAAHLEQAGVRFGVATGRDYLSVRRLFDDDRTCIATGLVSNGKRVFLDGEQISVTYVDGSEVERIVEIIAPIPGCYVNVSGDAHVMCDGRAVLGISADDYARTVRGRLEGHPVAAHADFNVIGGAVFFDPVLAADVSMDAVREQILAVCPGIDLLRAGPGLLDILPKGWSKASGLGILLDRLGIDAADVCAFGDADNDLELLKSVGISVATANASARVAEACAHHIGYAKDDAVAQAMEMIAATNARGSDDYRF